ncbi:MAG: ArsR family transcriptional regulator [Candidatus Heimdallarchaeota archaeon]|nr:ArsR family transcriptional regulator [Candidatus Heimdallarchaeota archaeon]MCK4609935.1 ArsR family transcriptional regulator [Candidatus Heimdallarchaeota archaeon]
MSKTFVTYFDEKTLFFLLKEGLSKGDKISLLINELVEEQYIEKNLQLLKELSIKPSLKRIDFQRIEQSSLITTIANVFEEAKGEVIVNLNADQQELLIALTINTILFMKKINRSYYYSCSKGEFVEVELPKIVATVDKSEKKILLLLKERKKTFRLLVEESKLSKSTISRIMKFLEKEGLAKTTVKRRELEAELTLAGELILKVS